MTDSENPDEADDRLIQVKGWQVSRKRVETVRTMPRSVSQVKEYLHELGGCGYRYFLGRVVRAWSRPAAWSPQGTAVHAAAEAWERSGRELSREATRAKFTEEYAKEINLLTEETPNFDLWFSSGPYFGQADTDRRHKKGLEQVDAYIDYYTKEAPEEVIWITPDGEPAVELEFNIDLDGVAMRGFIDQVVQVRPPLPDKPRTRSGAVSKSKASREEWDQRLAEWGDLPPVLRVRDIKTGANPGDSFQLGTYAVAIELEHGAKAEFGDFWMGRLGRPTKAYELMDRDGIAELARKADQGIKAGVFEPNPDPDKCGRCDYRTACDFSAA